jgi:hypothetical protein
MYLFIGIVVIVVLVLILCVTNEDKNNFNGGVPYPNKQLYDVPYIYPRYLGAEAVAFDKPGRCTAYCSNPPCFISCV